MLGGCCWPSVGDMREVPFHAAYIVFSLIAALAMWSLARRFSPQPLWADAAVLRRAGIRRQRQFARERPSVPGVLDARDRAVRVAAIWAGSRGAWRWRRSRPTRRSSRRRSSGSGAGSTQRKSRTAWAVSLTPARRGRRLPTLRAVHQRGAAGDRARRLLQHATACRLLANKLRNAAALSVHFFFIVFPPFAVRRATCACGAGFSRRGSPSSLPRR